MTTKAVREAAATMGRAGRGPAKRRGDAAHYAALRMKRAGTVSIEDLRAAAQWLDERDFGAAGGNPVYERVAAWLEREADRRERINQQRASRKAG